MLAIRREAYHAARDGLMRCTMGGPMLPLLGTLKRAVYPVSSKLVARAWLVDGVLKGSGVPFKTLFVHDGNFNESLQKKMYEGEPRVLFRRRIPIAALGALLARRRGAVDLAVAVVPTFYERMFGDLADLKGREEVQQVIDTSVGWEAMRQAFVKKKRQITNNFDERYGLSYRVSNAPADLDVFYHRMHVPHIRRRYGELALIDSYEETKAFFEKGRLLFVTKDGEDVAGALSLVDGKTIVFRRTGVLDGDEDVVKGGAQTALYFFQLKYAVENGFTAVDAMNSAPFLNDGVFRHKAEWGARAWPDREATRWVYWFTRGPGEKLGRFFDANPVVVDRPGGGLRGVVGSATDPSRLHTRGLDDLLVYGADGTKVVPVVEEKPAPPAAKASG